MGFAEAVQSCSSKYVQFNGRASRSEYWWFTLFCILVIPAIIAVGVPIIVAIGNKIAGVVIGLLMFLGFLGIFMPHLAVTIRRIHDINMPGWWFLVAFVPAGSLALLVFTLIPGTRGNNRFGPDPLVPQQVAGIVEQTL